MRANMGVYLSQIMKIWGISMILTNEGSQYLYGTKYNKKTDQQGYNCRYELLIYPRKSYGQIINNLIAIQGRLTIKTNWDLDWKVNQYFVDNYGKKYLISEVQKMPQEINSQVLAINLNNPDTDFVLSLIEIDNAEGLQ